MWLVRCTLPTVYGPASAEGTAAQPAPPTPPSGLLTVAQPARTTLLEDLEVPAPQSTRTGTSIDGVGGFVNSPIGLRDDDGVDLDRGLARMNSVPSTLRGAKASGKPVDLRKNNDANETGSMLGGRPASIRSRASAVGGLRNSDRGSIISRRSGAEAATKDSGFEI